MLEESSGSASLDADPNESDSLVGTIAMFLGMPILCGLGGLFVGLFLVGLFTRRIGPDSEEGFYARVILICVTTIVGAFLGVGVSIWAFWLTRRDKAKHRRHMANHIDSDL